jgi:hypothetical protein
MSIKGIQMRSVTLPIGTRLIFESLADISEAMGEDREKVIYELAKESLHSFTPSGEIGDNPTKNERINVHDFFESFPEIFSIKTGIIARSMKGKTQADIKNTIRNIQSSIVTLIKAYAGKKKSKEFNLFASTVIVKTIGTLFEMIPSDIDKIINTNRIKLGDTKEDQQRFIEEVKDIWNIEIV